MNKRCYSCKIEMPVTNFNRNSYNQDGLQKQCRACQSKYTLKWQKENKSTVNARTYRWVDNNRAAKNALNSKRRATQLNATPKWLTEEQLVEIKEFYELAQELSWLSEGGLDVDHIIPLQNDTVCGLHVPWNLQILPKSDNVTKSNKLS